MAASSVLDVNLSAKKFYLTTRSFMAPTTNAESQPTDLLLVFFLFISVRCVRCDGIFQAIQGQMDFLRKVLPNFHYLASKKEAS